MTPSPLRHLYLIIPPERETLEGFSSGLISIANYVRDNLGAAINLEIHDLSRVLPRDMGNRLGFLRETLSPVFVGITTTTATYQSALGVARWVKKHNPNAKVIFGGHHAQAQGEVILRNHRNEVDFVVKGEGELPMAELLRAYPRIENVPGLMWLDAAENQVRSNPSPPRLDRNELDKLHVWYEGAVLGSTPGKFGHVTYVSARGCPLKCAFCAVANETIHSKSDTAIVEDLRHLVIEKGFRKIAFENNFFAQSARNTESLCRAIIAEMERDPAFRFEWDCQTRVESMRHRELVQLMKRAGCRSVYLGVENFDADMLRYLGKSNSPENYLRQTYEVAKLLAEEEIEVFVNVQVGLPREDRTVRENNLYHLRSLARLVRSLGGKLVIFPMIAVVYPGTAHFRELVSQGMTEEIYETYTRWEDEHDEVRAFFGRNFAHGRGGLPMGILNREEIFRGVPMLDAERLEEVKRYLEEIKAIHDLEVFDYSGHLVTPA